MELFRLKKRREFVSLTTKGQFIKSGTILLQVLPNSLGVIRVGFTVSKKVSKKAVIRNRIRRRLKEVVRLNLIDPSFTGYDFVLIGRFSVLDKAFSDLVQDFKNTLSQIQK